MFIKLKAPVQIVSYDNQVARTVEQDVFINVAYIGYAIFRKTEREISLVRDRGPNSKLPAGAPCIEIQHRGQVGDIVTGAADRYLIVFSDDQRGEYERLKRIVEGLVVDR